MEIKTFGVIGAGQMGNGIAQVAAMSGLDVIMNDISDEFVQRGMGNITKILSRGVDKGKMSEDDKNAVLGRIKPSTSLKDMTPADFVDETGYEPSHGAVDTRGSDRIGYLPGDYAKPA